MKNAQVIDEARLGIMLNELRLATICRTGGPGRMAGRSLPVGDCRARIGGTGASQD